jgi:hypothetical protein
MTKVSATVKITTPVKSSQMTPMMLMKQKLQGSPGLGSTFKRLYGVVITTIKQDDGEDVGVVVETTFRCRSFFNGRISSKHLAHLAPTTSMPLLKLPITGNVWKKSVAELTLKNKDMDKVDEVAPYMSSMASQSPGSASVMLLTAMQLQVLGDDHDFTVEVVDRIKRFFEETKQPPTDDAAEESSQSPIKSMEDAMSKWNAWSPWTVTEKTYVLDTDSKVMAFLELASSNFSSN